MLMKHFSHEHVLGLLGLSEGVRGPLVVLPYMERGDLLTYVKDENTVSCCVVVLLSSLHLHVVVFYFLLLFFFLKTWL